MPPPPSLPPLPPDRSHVHTEQPNPRAAELHTRSVAELVELFNREDRTVLDALDAARPAIAAFLEAAEPGFLAGGRLIYLGAGTSGRLGVLDASECPPTFQTPPERVVGLIAGGDSALRRSSEGREDDPDGACADLDALRLARTDTLVGIAAGGTTPYVLGGLAHARSLADPPLTALLTCSPVSPNAAAHLIVLPTGPEVLTGSTRMKAGTATKLALNIISTTLMVRSGRVYRNLMVDLRATNAKLRDRAARVVATLTGLSRAESFDLLDRAGGSVKTAVVMRRRSLERAGAEAALAAAGGRLDLVIDG